MNCVTFAKEGILVHDSNDGAPLSFHNTTNSTNINIGHLVVVDTLDVYLAMRQSLGNNTNIGASNTTIGTTIHKRLYWR